MRRNTLTRQLISGKEENIMANIIAEYRKKKLNDAKIVKTNLDNEIAEMDNEIAETSQHNEINEIAEIAEDPSNYNYNTIHTVQNTITTPQESHTSYSQLSVAPPLFLVERYK